LRKAIVISKR